MFKDFFLLILKKEKKQSRVSAKDTEITHTEVLFPNLIKLQSIYRHITCLPGYSDVNEV